MNQKIKYFGTHKEFYTYTNKYLPTLDVKNSVARSRFTFKADGKLYAHANLLKQLLTLNELIGEYLFILTGSRPVGRSRYAIFVNEDIESNFVIKEVPEPTIEDTPELISTEVVVESVEDAITEKVDEPEDVVEEPVVEGETLEVDWEWVDSLEDSPENRLALDEYAEKFEVNLKRTMKTSNMAKKFKEAMSAK